MAYRFYKVLNLHNFTNLIKILKHYKVDHRLYSNISFIEVNLINNPKNISHKNSKGPTQQIYAGKLKNYKVRFVT